MPSGFVTPAAGGGAQPITRVTLATGGNILVTNGGSGGLPWVFGPGPHLLVDLTDPTEPTIISDGVYAVTAHAFPPDGLTTGGSWHLDLELDFLGDDQHVTSWATATAAQPLPDISVALTYWIPAGGAILVSAANNDGVSARNFRGLGLYIQRLG